MLPSKHMHMHMHVHICMRAMLTAWVQISFRLKGSSVIEPQHSLIDSVGYYKSVMVYKAAV